MAVVRAADRAYAVVMALLGLTLVVRYMRDSGSGDALRLVVALLAVALLVGGVVLWERRSGS